MRNTLVLILAALPLLCAAQQAPPNKPAEEDVYIRVFKLGIDTGCRNAGKKRNDPPEQVEAFCSCVMQTLQDNVSADTWQQISAQIRSGHTEHTTELLTPYLGKLAQCKQQNPDAPNPAQSTQT